MFLFLKSKEPGILWSCCRAKKQAEVQWRYIHDEQLIVENGRGGLFKFIADAVEIRKWKEKTKGILFWSYFLNTYTWFSGVKGRGQTLPPNLEEFLTFRAKKYINIAIFFPPIKIIYSTQYLTKSLKLG